MGIAIANRKNHSDFGALSYDDKLLKMDKFMRVTTFKSIVIAATSRKGREELFSTCLGAGKLGVHQRNREGVVRKNGPWKPWPP